MLVVFKRKILLQLKKKKNQPAHLYQPNKVLFFYKREWGDVNVSRLLGRSAAQLGKPRPNGGMEAPRALSNVKSKVISYLNLTSASSYHYNMSVKRRFVKGIFFSLYKGIPLKMPLKRGEI